MYAVPFIRHKVFFLFVLFKSNFTHPACRTPHTPSHSTVCSAPKPDMDYRHLHTSEQSEGKEMKKRLGSIHYSLIFLFVKHAWTYCTVSCGWAAYLQYEVPVWGELKVKVLVVQMFSEGRQELVLPADVCGQDERAQLLFHVLPAEHRGGRHWAKTTQPLIPVIILILPAPTAIFLLQHTVYLLVRYHRLYSVVLHTFSTPFHS